MRVGVSRIDSDKVARVEGRRESAFRVTSGTESDRAVGLEGSVSDGSGGRAACVTRFRFGNGRSRRIGRRGCGSLLGEGSGSFGREANVGSGRARRVSLHEIGTKGGGRVRRGFRARMERSETSRRIDENSEVTSEGRAEG